MFIVELLLHRCKRFTKVMHKINMELKIILFDRQFEFSLYNRSFFSNHSFIKITSCTTTIMKYSLKYHLKSAMKNFHEVYNFKTW